MDDLKNSPEIGNSEYLIDEAARLAIINALAGLPYKDAWRLMSFLSNLKPTEGSETPKIIME